MTVNVLLAVCTVDPDLVNLARAFKATRAQIFRKIEFPSSLPPMFVELRIDSTLAVVGIGDAADTLSPNIGQGGGSMMNALSLAVHLDRGRTRPLRRLGRRQGRPIIDHTQRISVFVGLPEIGPPPLRTAALALAGRSKWPTSSAPAPSDRDVTTKGNRDTVHWGVAVDEIDALPGDSHPILALH
jgi:Binding-protein-dependent transport system inner membrane component